MKRTCKFISLCLSLLFAVGLFGCNRSVVSTLDFTCFNTGVHVEVKGKKLSESLSEQIKNTLFEIEEEYKPNGELLSAINDLNIGETLSLSPTQNYVFETATTAYNLTDKKFDISILPLVNLWQFMPEYPVDNFVLPSEGQISDAKAKVGLDNLEYNKSQGFIKKLGEIYLDFGGIIKGYGADLIGDLLMQNGYLSGYVSIGGSSLFVLSSKTVGIRHPQNTADKILTVSTRDIGTYSVSTSGTYERYYNLNGVSYSHIINPKTGMPTQSGITSATVIGTTAFLGDAFSTALCLCERNGDDIRALVGKITELFPSAKVFIVYDKENEKEIITNCAESDFTINDANYSVVKLAD